MDEILRLTTLVTTIKAERDAIRKTYRTVLINLGAKNDALVAKNDALVAENTLLRQCK